MEAMIYANLYIDIKLSVSLTTDAFPDECFPKSILLFLFLATTPKTFGCVANQVRWIIFHLDAFVAILSEECKKPWLVGVLLVDHTTLGY